MSIFRFGFFATFTLYLVLLFGEYLRPGFVVTNVNVHWLWAVMAGWVAIEVGLRQYRKDDRWGEVLETVANERKESRLNWLGRAAHLVLFAMFGILLGLVVWRVGEAFGGMRLLFALASAVTPFLLVRSFRID